MSEPAISAGALGWCLVLLLPLAIVVAALSALLERSGPIRLHHWAEEAGGSLRTLYAAPVHFGVFRYLFSFLARLGPITLFLVLAELLAALNRTHPHAWALLLVMLLVAAIEAANRILVGHDPETALRALTYGYRIGLAVLRPLVALIAPLVPAHVLGRREEDEEGEASDEEIEAFIDVGTREGILEEATGEMLWSLVSFVDTAARSVMTPRIDIVCAGVDSSFDALVERFVDSGHSRIPIFEGSIDKIVGILHIRDLLRALRASEQPALASLLNPPLFIPETKPLGELLKELQARFQQVAVVVDEYGGTAGLLTIEDIVEEIVGEIMDEHDALVAQLEPVEGGFRMEGRARIELLEELFDVEIEDPEYETVAGLIFTELGRVPEVGESVELQGLHFTVEAVADRRIERVRVLRTPGPEVHRGGED